MVEFTIPLVLDIIRTVGILVAIVYYITIMRNQQKTRELSLRAQELTLESQELTRKAQEHALETRQAQLFHGIFSSLNDDWWNAYYYFRSSEWTDWSDFSEKFYPPNETELGRAANIVARAREIHLPRYYITSWIRTLPPVEMSPVSYPFFL